MATASVRCRDCKYCKRKTVKVARRKKEKRYVCKLTVEDGLPMFRKRHNTDPMTFCSKGEIS